jgi:tetratricopeptide (TPR) repeat protein
MLAFAVLRFKKYPIISYGILFFFFSISIYLHIVKSLSDTRADRFMFFASVGLSILLVGLLIRILKVDLKTNTKVDLKKGEKQTLSSPLQSFNKLNISFKGVFIALLVFFSVITFSRNSIWENDFTLVENDMERLDNSARPHYYFATNLLQRIQQDGWNAETEKEMIYHYQRSIELSDSIYYGRIELGSYFSDRDRIDEGIAVFQETVDLFPNTSDPRHYLGQAFVQQEKYDSAIVHLEKSISLAPKSPDSYYLLAISYAKVGKLKKGEDLANKGLRKFPQASKSMYEALGHVYFEMDDMTKSTESTLKMIEHGGDSYKAYATVIGRYQSKGDDANAAKYYQSAIQQGIMQAQ